MFHNMSSGKGRKGGDEGKEGGKRRKTVILEG